MRKYQYVKGGGGAERHAIPHNIAAHFACHVGVTIPMIWVNVDGWLVLHWNTEIVLCVILHILELGPGCGKEKSRIEGRYGEKHSNNSSSVRKYHWAK